MRHVIFVGGIHGVGKTYICHQLAKLFGLLHYSASELIDRLRGEHFSLDKKVSDINNNQNLLLEAIEKYTEEGSLILLDGHFCLVNSAGMVSPIPIETFKSIAPKAIILLTDKVVKIQERLKKRDNSHYEIAFLDQFQNNELNKAKEVSEKLNVPFVGFNVSNDKIDDTKHSIEYVLKLVNGGD